MKQQPASTVSRVHLISGLPRAGSTLLCALLRQNPRFAAAITSPVASLIGALLPKMSAGSEFHVFFDEAGRRRMLRSIFDAYYAELPAELVIFDTNRTWTARAALTADLYPQSRIICCVRDIGWIIDSIERLLRNNPLQMSRAFNFQPGSSIYARVETLMNSESGLIGLPWAGLREAWFSDLAKRLIVINYETLARQPDLTLRCLYEELDEPVFAHDFDHVRYEELDYDDHLGMPGLHSVREKVEFKQRESCIPPDLFARYSDASFWARPDMNRRGVRIL
jgi:sulfotransferase